MLTLKDLNEIEKLIDNKFDERLEHIPSTELFLDWMSKIMGELQSLRNNDDILNDRTSDHTDQLENHEQRISKLEQPQILVT